MTMTRTRDLFGRFKRDDDDDDGDDVRACRDETHRCHDGRFCVGIVGVVERVDSKSLFRLSEEVFG